VAALLALAIVATLTFVASERKSVPAGPLSTIPTQGLALDSIAMFNNSGWALGSDFSGVTQMVLRTSDGALSWRVVTPPFGKGSLIGKAGLILGFEPIDENSAFVVVSEPGPNRLVGVWSTDDGGNTWSRVTGPSLDFKSVLLTFSDRTHGWLAVPGEPATQNDQQAIVIDRTLDGGKSWHEVSRAAFPPTTSTPGGPSLQCGKSDLSFLNASTGWLTGGCAGAITFDVSADGGLTWAPQPFASPDGASISTDCSPGPCVLSAPHFPTPGLGYMVLHDYDLTRDAGRSTLYVSHDGGQSWNSHRLPGQEAGVLMVNASVGFASTGHVDLSGHWLYRTNDGGVTWQAVPTKLQLLGATLDCISTTTCFGLTVAVPSYNGSESARLYKTTDGGMTWALLSTSTTDASPTPPAPSVLGRTWTVGAVTALALSPDAV